MTDLARQACEPCTGDSPAVPEAEWGALLGALPGWEVRSEDGVPMLTRRFKLNNFLAALELANAVGELAESEDHHPRLVVEYGSLAVTWWTHAIGGLHRNDFIMAARTDQLV
ncbi:MAG: 4a-hydroxytetrahydrobiopterin dehydratase [Pseudomonadales bacterium]